MKRFDELTEPEIVALSDADIAYYMDYECAKEGVPLLPRDPGPAPTKPGHEPDTTVYDVGGIEVATAEDAARLVELANSLRRIETHYVSGAGCQRTVTSAATPLVVRPERYYSLTEWDRVKAEVTKYESDKREHEKSVEEHRKIAKERDRVCSWIVERRDEANERAGKSARYAAELLRYVEIANGDEAMARAFLVKAHPEAEAFLPGTPAAFSAVAAGPRATASDNDNPF